MNEVLRMVIAFDGKADPYFAWATEDGTMIGNKVPAILAQKQLIILNNENSKLRARLEALERVAAEMAERLRALRTFQEELNMRSSVGDNVLFTPDDEKALVAYEVLK